MWGERGVKEVGERERREGGRGRERERREGGRRGRERERKEIGEGGDRGGRDR